MAITYKVCKCRNPKHPDTPYFKATAVKAASDYDFNALAEDIADGTTVTKADCMAVFTAMKPKIKKALLAGRRVVLSELGSFYISLQGKSYNAETMQDEEFKPADYIKGSRIVFRPEVVLNRELKREMTLKRVSSEVMA